MNPFPWIDESFSLNLIVTLIHFVWQGAAVGLIVVAAGWLLKRAAAQVRYSLNVAAMLLMVACLPVTFAFVNVRQDAGAVSQLTAGGSPSAFASPANLATPPMFTSDTKIEPDNRSLYTVPSQSAETAESILSQALAWLIWAAPYATAVYFLGVALMMLRLSTALWGGHKLRRASSPVDDDSLLMMVQRQARGIGLKIAPAVALCERISIPVVVGVVKPMILLPAALASGLSPDQLQLLVTHELAHVRRYDLLVNLLQRLIEAVLFFHPVVWFVSRRVSIERENAADDLVLTVGCQSALYANALVRMAELSSALRNSRIANQATALAASGTNASEFKRRVLRLLENTDTPKLRLTRGGILSLMLIATSLLVAPVIVQSWTKRSLGADELTDKYEALQGTWGVESFRKDGIPDPSVVGYPLHSAAVYWPEQIADIVADGVLPDVTNDAGLTPIQTAVSQRAQLGVAKLLAVGADPNIGNADGNSPLAQAAMWGDLQTVRLLIRFGADVNAEYQTQPALHHAIVHDHREIVRLLLKQPSINLDQKSTGTGWTPLHLAVQHDRKEFIELLLAKHADATLRDNVGNTPHDLAMHKSDKALAQLLKPAES